MRFGSELRVGGSFGALADDLGSRSEQVCLAQCSAVPVYSSRRRHCAICIRDSLNA